MIYRKNLLRLVDFSITHAVAVICVSLAIAAASLAYAILELPINSDQESLVLKKGNPYLERDQMFFEAFPKQANTILVLLRGDNAWRVGAQAERLAEALSARRDLFKDVFYPQGMRFFHQNGLLYLDAAELEKFTDGLIEAQPAMAALAKDPSLRGLWGLLTDGLAAERDQKLPPSFDEMIRRLHIAIGDFLNGRTPHDPWANAFPDWYHNSGEPRSSEPHQEAVQVIIVQPKLDFSKFLSAEKSIRALHQIAAALEVEKDGVEMMLTGREPLTFDELYSLITNILIVTAISALAILILLSIGIGSWRMIVIIMSVLVIGICWSLGWAALAVGELNMVSVAFVVLFLGICVDFSIHVALRYQEAYRNLGDMRRAMAAVVEGAGAAISLCAVAMAIGFLSFVPTKFLAFRDLGIIASGSMILALLSSWTLLPALLRFVPARDLVKAADAKPNIIGRFSIALYGWIRNHYRAISLIALLLAVGALPYALQMRFDYSTLAIKDPQSQSVIALKILQRHGLYTDYTLNLLVEDKAAAKQEAARFAALPLVRRVDTHEVYVPKGQAEKIDLIEEAAFFMTPVFAQRAEGGQLTDAELRAAARKLLRRLAQKKKRLGALPQEQERLGRALTALLRQPSAALLGFNQALMGDYVERLARLRRSLAPEPFRFDDLPENVRQQIQTDDGRIKITIYPKEDMTDSAALRRFVERVIGASQAVSGRPIVEYAVGQIATDSFRTALILAFAAIGVILLVSLRSVKNTLLVLAPIALSAIGTLAICVWAGIAFNFVNVLLLPLLLGIGVANGIHILSRAEHEKNIRDVMQSSTPIAIFLSNATTLASFGSLVIATHLGLRSMGLTLTIAMILLMLAALIVLPALIAWSRARLP